MPYIIDKPGFSDTKPALFKTAKDATYVGNMSWPKKTVYRQKDFQ